MVRSSWWLSPLVGFACGGPVGRRLERLAGAGDGCANSSANKRLDVTIHFRDQLRQRQSLRTRRECNCAGVESWLGRFRGRASSIYACVDEDHRPPTSDPSWKMTLHRAGALGALRCKCQGRAPDSYSFSLESSAGLNSVRLGWFLPGQDDLSVNSFVSHLLE